MGIFSRTRHGALIPLTIAALALVLPAASAAAATAVALFVLPESGVSGYFPQGTLFRDGTGALDITESLPRPPEANEPLGAWHRMLYQDIHLILAQVGPLARGAVPGRLSLATD